VYSRSVPSSLQYDFRETTLLATWYGASTAAIPANPGVDLVEGTFLWYELGKYMGLLPESACRAWIYQLQVVRQTMRRLGSRQSSCYPCSCRARQTWAKEERQSQGAAHRCRYRSTHLAMNGQLTGIWWMLALPNRVY